MGRKKWIGLISFIIICLGAGGLGAVATTPEIDGWYKTIEKPSWNPPAYVFGPVWTTLFVMMAVAAWLVWKPVGLKAARTPRTLFTVQLVPAVSPTLAVLKARATLLPTRTSLS